MPGRNLGRLVFGAATLGAGVLMLVWHDARDYELLRPILNAGSAPIVLFIAGIAQIFGGVAIQFARSAKAGAAAIVAVEAGLVLACVPNIVATPRIYNSWGNLFEPFSLAVGAGLVYAQAGSRWTPAAIARAGRLLFGVCVVSFALEQAFYLDNTAVLVPRWLPPSQMFWAIATTVAFALAAVALLTNRQAHLATRLLKAMLLVFALAVWLPRLARHPAGHAVWSETVETFAIAGVAWILDNLLADAQQPREAHR